MVLLVDSGGVDGDAKEMSRRGNTYALYPSIVASTMAETYQGKTGYEK